MAVPCVRLALLLCLMIPATVASPRSRSLRKSPAHASASRPTAFFENQPGYQNGPFREVTARVDGVLAGSVCPFPVIYPGGIYPLLWRPIAPIGSFNLPTYDIELTPFLGKLLDGKAHEFAFAVTNAMDVWYIDANLHLWLDPRGTATTAGLVCRPVEPPSGPEDGPQVSDLGPHRPPAVSVHGGHLPGVQSS
ncbi:unnamed protein product [Triticum turgidum subsp. durum]|uniref:Peptide N-acetyl-beta-D-glucosaminyl asparaginase amidase A N-terminal domain-containing protein n=1 Tax=Triticum turgidum subsp. durum TaxID=4567 RepID=A0A9R0SG39_TRITD|nr:unnamed protein product [Triticum turgidum subsp. durum]